MAWTPPSSRVLFDAPERLTDVGSWHTHIPFAFWCVEALRPRVLVELGTHKGDSYSAFCQAVQRLALPTACYAVDTWRGDHEAGFYGDEVLEDLRAFHDPRFASFSRLVRSTFDEALPHFADGSIDLLHVDGLHTYEAVKHDFETWRPKMSARGVVLFHDVNVRELDFGAWRFWDEARAGAPHFTFLHGHGLGVLLVGTDVPEPLRELAACPPDEAAGPRAFFATLGHQVELATRVERLSARLDVVGREGAQREQEVARLAGEAARLEGALAEERAAAARLRATADQQVAQASQQLAALREEATRAAQAAELAFGERLAALRSACDREVEALRHELAELRGQRDHQAEQARRELAALRAQRDQQAEQARHELAALREEKDRAGEQARLELEGARSELARHLARWPARLERRVASVTRIPRRVGHALSLGLETIGWAARFRLREGLRLRKHERMIRRAWLLDPDYYLAQCGDDPAARENPIRHYLQHGAARGLDPNPFFDTTYYVEQHASVAAYGKNPLIHFIRYGARDRLDPSPAFDTSFYLASHPAARESGLSPLSHYLVFGRQAGYACRPPPASGSPSPAADAFPSGPGLAVPPRDRVLVLDHRLPTPDQDSGSVRMHAIVEGLRGLGHEVTFASDSEERMPSYEAQLGRYASQVLYGMEQVYRHLHQEGGSYRHALLSRPQAERYMAMVRAFAPNATLLYDTVDLHWIRLAREADLTGNPATREWAERYRKIEGACAAASDLVLAITKEEAEALAREVPSARVAVLPNIHTVRPSVPGPRDRKGLFFIGGFEHQPNIDAVRWFAEDVLPLVRQAIPGVVFHVVGSKPTPEVLSLAGQAVDVAGYVADPDPYFDGCRVFVSPLRYGAGMKGKIGQAMSYGLPVVTTSIGAEGMRLVDGENALIADDAAAFAAAVVRLYREDDLWQGLSERSRRHLEANFSDTAVRPLLAALFPRQGTEQAARRTSSRPVALTR